MAVTATTGADLALGGRRTSTRLLRNRMLVLGAALLGAIALAALLGPLLYRVDPFAVDPANRLAAPGGAHPLGSDGFGRDILARILDGARTSLLIGVAVTAIATVAGGMIGLFAAFSRWFETLSMRFLDGVMAFPAILFAIAITAAFGKSPATVIVSLSIVFSPFMARVVRSAALAVRQQSFVEADRVQGASLPRIVLLTVLPNVVSPMVVQSAFIFAETLLIEAALSFIGAGVPAPAPSWGNMLEESRDTMHTAWWGVVFPALAIMLTILAINLLGEGLRNHFDPRHRFLPRRSRASR